MSSAKGCRAVRAPLHGSRSLNEEGSKQVLDCVGSEGKELVATTAGGGKSAEAICGGGYAIDYTGCIGIHATADSFSSSEIARKGTSVLTLNGKFPVSQLECGDRVLTIDHGYRPIRWIGRSTVAASGADAPVLFRKGALNNSDDLIVSPRNRIMLSGWRAELLFGECEVLAAAQDLVNGTSVIQLEGGTVTYVYLMFDEHEIIFTDASPIESYHPEFGGWAGLPEKARREMLACFPCLRGSKFAAYGPSERMTLNSYEAKTVASASFFHK